jgi:large subunit ribosomal protein L24
MAFKIPQRHQNKPRTWIKTKIKKDDTVRVISGKDKGKTGRVLDIDRERGKVLVEGVGLVKRHTRPNPAKQIKGGIAERENPIAISNVMMVTSGGIATRVGYRIEETASATHRIRFARKGGEILDKKA